MLGKFSKFVLVAALFFIVADSVFSRELESIRRDIEADLSRTTISLGSDFCWASSRRGAFLYSKPTVHPVFHFHFSDSDPEAKGKSRQFWKPQIEVSLERMSAGISYSHFLNIAAGINFFSGGEWIRIFGDELRHRTDRSASIEIFGEIEVIPFWFWSIRTQLAKDLNEYEGIYLNHIHRWSLGKGVWIEGEVGYGTFNHNHYLYGEGAQSGWSNYGAGLGYEWPLLFWNIAIETSVKESGVLGKNRQADRVKDHPDVFSFQLTIQRAFRF